MLEKKSLNNVIRVFVLFYPLFCFLFNSTVSYAFFSGSFHPSTDLFVLLKPSAADFDSPWYTSLTQTTNFSLGETLSQDMELNHTYLVTVTRSSQFVESTIPSVVPTRSYNSAYLTPPGATERIDISASNTSFQYTYTQSGAWSMSMTSTVSATIPAGTSVVSFRYQFGLVNVSIVDITPSEAPKSDNEALNDIDKGIQQGNQQAQDRFQQEVDSADSAGSDAGDFASGLENDVKSGWAILWYPITFTSDLLSVFTGGSAAVAYAYDGYRITGYQYNDLTGCLDPVLVRDDGIMPLASVGTVISFPSYTLPVLDLKLWDSFDYDLSTLRTDFPAVFNMSDVIISMLELYWCIGFLRDKYYQVFGG